MLASFKRTNLNVFCPTIFWHFRMVCIGSRFRFLFFQNHFLIRTICILMLYWWCYIFDFWWWLPYKKSSFLMFFKLNFSVCSVLFSFFSFYFVVFALTSLFWAEPECRLQSLHCRQIEKELCKQIFLKNKSFKTFSFS